jgi:hypothetical protein
VGGGPGNGGSSSGNGGSSSGNGGSSSGNGGSSSGNGGSSSGNGGSSSGNGGSSSGSGGATGQGGSTSTGGSSSGVGGSTSDECQKGQISGNEVVIMGESFYGLAPYEIEKHLEVNAKAAGALEPDYRNVAESGQPMSYIAGTEWTNATKSPVKVVIMDGGGIDCLTSRSCPTCAAQFTTLLGQMATAGVEDVIYTRYPEPGAPPGSDAALKQCLDTVMPTMQPVCEGATGLRCHWVDLRPVFVAGDTNDGLHPTPSGGEHVATAIWEEMVKECIAQ